MGERAGNEATKRAIRMAISTRDEERGLIEEFAKDGFKCVAVNVGGKMPNIVPKIIENALVASVRKGIIEDTRTYNGAIAGAIREALNQIQNNMNGLSVGGKIGVARQGEDLSVALYFSIGLLHLNETVMAVSHRAVPLLEGENSN
ncbi:hypothetical protein PM10SUCC1_13720 [Propionigenium maris DSM 9537]|uniref:Hut operon positive regulatory protein n=1 Tax=Propionigenium maris DSM 9537 TaxID=1123000 RepID=A0A9W6GKA4_9FUSO|nr:HutP family protein [Propionigenium maris]GLI55858.1 hypothetical protein PM10SUCC1_13720 [Propionigenium maris DSM 9537]